MSRRNPSRVRQVRSRSGASSARIPRSRSASSVAAGRNDGRAVSLRQHCGDNVLIFLRLKRTGGIDDTATRTHGPQCRSKNGALALRLAGKVFGPQAVADFRIAAQRAGAAAGHIRQDHVELGLETQCGRIGEAAVDAGGERRKAFAQRLEALRVCFTGDDARKRIALGENEGFAAGSCAGVQDSFCSRTAGARRTRRSRLPVASLHPECGRGFRERPPWR